MLHIKNPSSLRFPIGGKVFFCIFTNIYNIESKRSFSLNSSPRVPDAYNEPILEYAKGSKERHQLEHTIQTLKKQTIGILY
jgi:hypothetical protein